jgi:hypothetical protein
MPGEHLCGQLTVKTWVSLIAALPSGPRDRSRMQQRDEQRRLEFLMEAVSLREAWSWRRTRNSRLSAHAAHSFARSTGDGVHPVILLTRSAFQSWDQRQK